ncbi:MAG: discoidin domain-containing protein [Acidimicrobiia bacterium]
MADKHPSSDELIAQARATSAAHRGSISASMAEAAQEQLADGPDDAYQSPDIAWPQDPATSPGSADPDEPDEPERSPRRPSPPPSRSPKMSQPVVRQPSTPSVEPTTRSRKRLRRIPGLIGMAVFALWFLLGNFDSVIGEIGDFIDSAGDAVPAVDEAAITNLTRYQETTASNIYQGQAPFRAVDGDPTSAWNSGGYPTQWIAIDLNGTATLTSARLLVGQNPPGATVHQLIGWGPAFDESVLYEFDQTTTDDSWIEVTFSEPIAGISHVAVVTISSPSWTAWREIEIYGTVDNSLDSA